MFCLLNPNKGSVNLKTLLAITASAIFISAGSISVTRYTDLINSLRDLNVAACNSYEYEENPKSEPNGTPTMLPDLEEPSSDEPLGILDDFIGSIDWDLIMRWIKRLPRFAAALKILVHKGNSRSNKR